MLSMSIMKRTPALSDLQSNTRLDRALPTLHATAKVHTEPERRCPGLGKGHLEVLLLMVVRRRRTLLPSAQYCGAMHRKRRQSRGRDALSRCPHQLHNSQRALQRSQRCIGARTSAICPVRALGPPRVPAAFGGIHCFEFTAPKPLPV